MLFFWRIPVVLTGDNLIQNLNINVIQFVDVKADYRFLVFAELSVEFIRAFEQAGFGAVCLDKWEEEPWQVVEGTEFRAVTLVAFKGYGKECIDRGHAVIYRGPYTEVRDEEGHVFPRGERIAVCERTFRTLTEGPCRKHFIGIEPKVLGEPVAWCAPPATRRSPAETKGGRQIAECGGEKCC